MATEKPRKAREQGNGMCWRKMRRWCKWQHCYKAASASLFRWNSTLVWGNGERRGDKDLCVTMTRPATEEASLAVTVSLRNWGAGTWEMRRVTQGGCSWIKLERWCGPMEEECRPAKGLRRVGASLEEYLDDFLWHACLNDFLWHACIRGLVQIVCFCLMSGRYSL